MNCSVSDYSPSLCSCLSTSATEVLTPAGTGVTLGQTPACCGLKHLPWPELSGTRSSGWRGDSEGGVTATPQLQTFSPQCQGDLTLTAALILAAFNKINMVNWAGGFLQTLIKRKPRQNQSSTVIWPQVFFFRGGWNSGFWRGRCSLRGSSLLSVQNTYTENRNTRHEDQWSSLAIPTSLRNQERFFSPQSQV